MADCTSNRPRAVSHRKATAPQNDVFTGFKGEIIARLREDMCGNSSPDPRPATIVLHDGATLGGIPMLREDLANLAEKAITAGSLADGLLEARHLPIVSGGSSASTSRGFPGAWLQAGSVPVTALKPAGAGGGSGPDGTLAPGDQPGGGPAGGGGITPYQLSYQMINYLTPIGLMSPFGGATAPPGWLLCDGAAVSRTVYAALYAVLGDIWGNGDGVTTFNVPDQRGRVAMGAGTGTAGDATAHRLGATGGSEGVALTIAQMPAHDHGGDTQTLTVPQFPNVMGPPGHGSGGYNVLVPHPGINANIPVSMTLKTEGGGAAHPNLQPYAAPNFIIFSGVLP